MQKRERHSFWVGVLWAGFIALTLAILYLSLQDGNDAKEQMYKIIEYAARLIDTDVAIQVGDADAAAYLIRQAGRAGAFFLLGILGTLAVHVTFRKANWFIKTSITTLFLVAIAYYTEKVKEYLPTRHYSREEMMISIVSVVLGFLFVSFITFFVWIVKGFLRLVAPRE